MEDGGGKRHAGAPRMLDVQKFAYARGAEVEALHAVLKEKKEKHGSDRVAVIPRCLRRRTTSHNRRKSFFWQRKDKKRKFGALDEAQMTTPGDEGERLKAESEEISSNAKGQACRRIRRRIELKGDEKGGGGCSRDGTQRLVTHVWHAKRFTMKKIWGHWLAEGLPGRGRGSRAVIKWANEAAVLHDASFFSVIELKGSGKCIIDALQLVLEPAPRSVELMSPTDRAVHDGASYGRAMLHHMGNCPRRSIAPVKYIWRPESEGEEERQIWLWVHAAAYEEALTCLQLLCQKQTICGRDQLQYRSRKGQLGRLDLFGSDAMSVLHKALHPVVRQTLQPRKKPGSFCSDDSTSNMATLRCLESSGASVVGMEVWDPRFRPDWDLSFQPSILEQPGSHGDGAENIDSTNSNSDSPSTSDHVGVNTLEMHLSGNRGAWDWLSMNDQDSLLKPLSEKDLSIKRHKRRLSYIQLNDSSEDVRRESSVAGENSKCHILVIKHVHNMPSACGFSLIMPIAWVRAFWVPLVFAGGHVIGLRERHWLLTDAKLASFPHDYPDCFSYDQHMASKALEYQEIYSRRPPSKRGIWKNELPNWRFSNEAPQLYLENLSPVRNVSTAEFRTEMFYSSVAADTEVDPSKTLNKNLVLPPSSGPAAPLPQLHTCSISHHIQSADSDAGIVGATSADDSVLDPSQRGIDAHIFLPIRCSTDQIVFKDSGGYCSSDTVVTDPIEVPDEGSKLDKTIKVHEEGSFHLVPTPMAIVVEKINDCSGATLEAFITSEKPDLSVKAYGKIKESKNVKVDFVEAAIEDLDFSGAEKVGEEPSMFVARTKETLQQALKDGGLQHLPLLTSLSMDALDTNGHSTPQLAGDGSAELVKIGSLVRVLIHAPRKGVFDDEAIIYMPLSSDVDSYFISPHKWQGFEDPNFKQVQQSSSNKRKSKQITKSEGGTPSPGSIQSQQTSSQTILHRPSSKFCSLRVPIGIVTSSMVRGSKSSSAVGVCEVAALGVLRERQIADKRWSSTSDIFLLARNKFSSMYRPALASIVIETGDDLG